MNELPIDSDLKPGIEADERWVLVQDILASSQFQKAIQLRNILLYISRRALEDQPGVISEHELGCNALGRRPNFDTNEDNIVRVQVRHLRKRLEEYFNGAGSEQPLVLTIPKGSYVPRFEPRSVVPAEEPEPIATIVATGPVEPIPVQAVLDVLAPDPAPAKTQPAWRWIAVVSLLGLGVLATMLYGQLRKESSLLSTPTSNSLWRQIFPAGQPVDIVVSDTCLVMLQDILDIDIPLAQYLGGGYPAKFVDAVQDQKLRDALRLIAARQYTSLGDMNLGFRLLDLGRKYNPNTQVKYARHLNARDFKSGNFVIVGSRRGIPWMQLFEPQLNFLLEEDRKTRRFHIRNREPRPGEQGEYGSGPKDESYAVIALLPNLDKTGNVLVLSGITMEMTEAAGQLVASEGFSAALAKLTNARTGEPASSSIEILIQAKTLAGTARDTKIIAHRLIAPHKNEP